MFDQLLANPGAMAYLFGSMGQAISPKGTWGERLGATAANMGGQMQQANALKELLGGQQQLANNAAALADPGNAAIKGQLMSPTSGSPVGDDAVGTGANVPGSVNPLYAGTGQKGPGYVADATANAASKPALPYWNGEGEDPRKDAPWAYLFKTMGSGGNPNLPSGEAPASGAIQGAGPTPSTVNYGTRIDGTSKGQGWLGPIPTPDGKVMTEKSISVKLNGPDGPDTLIPLLVPGTPKPDLDHLAAGRPPTTDMVDRAVTFAQKQMAAGQSPFAGATSAVQPSGPAVTASPPAPAAQVQTLPSSLPLAPSPAAPAQALSGLVDVGGYKINPAVLAQFTKPFNVPPGLFSPVNALGADLPNVLKTGAAVAQAQDELSGAKDMRNFVMKEIPLQQRLDQQEALATKRLDTQLKLQQMRDVAADDRLDKRERAAAKRQANQLGAMLEGIDRRIAGSQEKLGQPVAGVDENGEPAFFQFDKQGNKVQVKGAFPPATAQNRLDFSTLKSMLDSDVKLLDTTSDKEERAILTRRIKSTRDRMETMVATPPPTQPQASAIPPPASAKTITMDDVRATARASGKSEQEVLNAAKAKGYTLQQ